jgi:hypothetical protein
MPVIQEFRGHILELINKAMRNNTEGFHQFKAVVKLYRSVPLVHLSVDVKEEE